MTDTILTIHLIVIAAVLLLAGAVFLFHQTNMKRTAVLLHYVLRFMYLPAIFTGGLVLGLRPVYLGGLLKIACGFISVGLIEVYLVQLFKNTRHRLFTRFMIGFVLFTVILGLTLPQGISLL
ncbi:uncharacterized protein DUF1516 [Sinobaca qinghaiensis]|uniref:Uncharacterized protein DUF1516 n=1 Tax=Sinobaca qinghaiensis TaxID=342944 RepID=A0A419V7T7_9BACL|nr:DUF1516 family protein [Sinobaca qinghaiensis]RKD76013.1 uncharacterized protein DUF1516 [Sinobaca qinghaiensis]